MEISVSKLKFLFQTDFLCFKTLFLPLKSAKIINFGVPRGVMINAAYIENGVGGITVFLLVAIIGGENIYRDVRSKPERIHED